MRSENDDRKLPPQSPSRRRCAVNATAWVRHAPRHGVLPPSTVLLVLQRAHQVLRPYSRRLALGLFLRLWRQRCAVVDIPGLRCAAPDGLHWCDGRGNKQPRSDKRPLGSSQKQAACPRPGVTVSSVVYRHLCWLCRRTRVRRPPARAAAAGVSYTPTCPTPSFSPPALPPALTTQPSRRVPQTPVSPSRLCCESGSTAACFDHWRASY